MTRRLAGEIFCLLRDLEGGKTLADVCRTYGTSEEVVHSWLHKYRGLERCQIEHRMRETGRTRRTAAARVVAG